MSGLSVVGPPHMPKWLLYLRIAILVLSFGVLVASAYNVSLHDGYIVVSDRAPGFLIFDTIFTWLVLGAMLGIEFFAQKFYYRLVFIVLLTLNAIFWLAAWAWAASWASQWGSIGGYVSRSHIYGAFYGSIAASAALGAFTWVMVIVTVVFFTRACLADCHGNRATGDSELGPRKPDGATQNDVAQYPPPQDQRYV